MCYRDDNQEFNKSLRRLEFFWLVCILLVAIAYTVS